MELAYRFRLYLLTALIILGFGTLLHRLHEVQIKQQTKFRALMPSSKTVTIREPGVRGEIRDRNGVVLARNRRHYEVSFNIQEILNYYTLQHNTNPKTVGLRTENGMLRKKESKNIAKIVDETIISRLRLYNLTKNYSPKALEVHYATHRGLVPFSYSADLSYDEFARFAELNLELPGVYIDLKPEREYPYAAMACHVLGYTKQWEKGDIPDESAQRYDHYIGEEKGVAGIEASMDQYLQGPEGVKQILKDEKDRVIGMTDYKKPQIGADVILTIDSHLQCLLENTLRRAGRAAGVVMNVETGEILAMASVPNYDPNQFIPSISSKKWGEYRANPCDPLINRGISAYTPGSTFKLATAVTGARAGLGDKIYSCDGFIQYGNHKVGCWIWNQTKGKHGSEDVRKAIQQSCNPYFNRLANAAGPQMMAETFDMLNLGRPTGVELPNEKSGMVIGTKAWKQQFPGTPVTPVDTAFLSIGQGVSAATPLQLTAMVSAIANGGKYFRPRLVKRVIQNGKNVIPDEPQLVVNLLERGLKSEDLERIREGMRMAVNVAGGTAGRVKLPQIEAAAKTGTAQTIDRGKKSNNSWTVSFAPFQQPKYAVCVLVQGGKSGGKVCGPLVHMIYRGIFAQEDGMRLPLSPQSEFVGNSDMIEEIALPEDSISLDEPASFTETADDSTPELLLDRSAIDIEPNNPDIIPSPTITPDSDETSNRPPRAIPVPDESQ